VEPPHAHAMDAGFGVDDHEDAQPVVLEINYSADYAKQLELQPSFLDDAFEMLFLDACDGDAEGAAEAGADATPLWEKLPL
jgi:hypothetical protein